jgi:hypothetical protein
LSFKKKALPDRKSFSLQIDGFYFRFRVLPTYIAIPIIPMVKPLTDAP